MSGYPLLDIFWSMFLFFCWLLWIFLVGWILVDIFRSDLSGWKKAGWTCLVILVPLIGVLAYEIVHGEHMFGRRDYSYESSQARAYDQAYRSTANSSTYELSKLADLHQRGAISDAEFQRGKEKILS